MRMKTDKKETGQLGESIAADLLLKKGYEILERNVHAGHGELDIVARQGEILVFAEVKTRHAEQGKNSPYGSPADAVDRRKQEMLVKTAEEYLKRHTELKNLYPRIDVIEVYLDPNDAPTAVEHYENAVRKRNLKRNDRGSF